MNIVDVKLVNRTNDIVFEKDKNERKSKSEIIDRKEGLSLCVCDRISNRAIV
jgi:hypothetical protein